MKEKLIKVCDKIIEFSLYIIIFVLPFFPAAIEIFASLAILAWLIKKIAKYKSGLRDYFPATRLNRALLLFVAANIIAVVASIHHAISIKSLFGKVLEYLMLFFIAVEVAGSKRRLRNILVALVLSGGVVALEATVRYFSGAHLLSGRTITSWLLSTSLTNPNNFAGWLIVVIPSIAALLFQREKMFFRRDPRLLFTIFEKSALTALLVILLILVRLTVSWGAWSGLLAALLLIVAYRIKWLAGYRYKGLLILAVISFLATAVLVLYGEMKQQGYLVLKLQSIDLRLKLWKDAFAIIKDYPVWGSGLNTYSMVVAHYPAFTQAGRYVHNCYIQMMVETGVLGIGSFLWLLTAFFRRLFSVLRRRKDMLALGMGAGILAFLVQSFFDTNLYSLQLAVLFWTMLGVATALLKERRKGDIHGRDPGKSE